MFFLKELQVELQLHVLLNRVKNFNLNLNDYAVVVILYLLFVVRNAKQRNISAIRSMRSVAKDCLKMLSSSLYSIIVNAPHWRRARTLQQ